MHKNTNTTHNLYGSNEYEFMFMFMVYGGAMQWPKCLILLILNVKIKMNIQRRCKKRKELSDNRILYYCYMIDRHRQPTYIEVLFKKTYTHSQTHLHTVDTQFVSSTSAVSAQTQPHIYRSLSIHDDPTYQYTC